MHLQCPRRDIKRRLRRMIPFGQIAGRFIRAHLDFNGHCGTPMGLHHEDVIRDLHSVVYILIRVVNGRVRFDAGIPHIELVVVRADFRRAVVAAPEPKDTRRYELTPELRQALGLKNPDE